MRVAWGLRPIPPTLEYFIIIGAGSRLRTIYKLYQSPWISRFLSSRPHTSWPRHQLFKCVAVSVKHRQTLGYESSLCSRVQLIFFSVIDRFVVLLWYSKNVIKIWSWTGGPISSFIVFELNYGILLINHPGLVLRKKIITRLHHLHLRYKISRSVDTFTKPVTFISAIGMEWKPDLISGT